MELTLSERTIVEVTDSLSRTTRNDSTLAVSPATGGHAIVRDRIAHGLLALSEHPTALGDLIAEFPATPDAVVEVVSDLFERGILSLDGHAYGTSSTRPGPRRLNVLSADAGGNSYPVLVVFHNHNYCNLACTYCYTIDPSVTPERLSVVMMRSVVDQCLLLPTPSTTFEFHGGEPTMAAREIEEVVTYASDVYERAGKPVHFSIQTNAYALTPALVQFLARHKFQVRVSIDGTRDVHNATRVSRAGKGTYDRVVEGIRILQDAGLNPHAVAVVHRHNVDRMVEMYDALAALDVRGVRFLRVFKSLGATDDIWIDGDTYFTAYFKLIRHVITSAKAGRKVCALPNLVAGEIAAVTSFAREYMCMRSPCGAGTSMLGVDVNGDIYPCEEMMGKKEFVIGNVLTDSIRGCLDNNVRLRTLKERHPDDIAKCHACEWKQMCHGGCVHKSYTHFGRIDRESEYCSYYKQIYPALLWLEDEAPGSLDLLRQL